MLDRTAVKIRRRSPWQATELAWPLVRRTGPTLYTVWLLVTLPVWLLVTVATVGQTAWCLLLLWWLRPWFDIALVRTLGQAVFSPVDVRTALRGLPSALLRSLLPALTLDRIDPARSSNLPVRQLEQLRGRALLRRYSVLGAQERGVSVAWTVGCWLVEGCLLFALSLLLIQLSPAAFEQFWSDQFDALFVTEAPALHWLMSLLWFAVFALVEPVYVAGGLCLYLNRRTALEGWDVEIAFRGLARRAETSSRGNTTPGRSAASLALLLGALLFTTANLSLPDAGFATTAATPAGGLEQVEQQMGEILDDPLFGGERTRKRWKLRWELDEQEAAESGDLDWLRAIPWFGQLLEILLWVALAAALITLLVVAFRSVPTPQNAAPRRRRQEPSNWQVAGMDVRPESLPGDLLATARGLLQQGRLADALSLLYRGTLSQLVESGVAVPDSWTELDCVRGTRAQLDETSHGYLRRLTGTWTRAAYAGIPPTATEVVELCDDYAGFSPSRASEPAAGPAEDEPAAELADSAEVSP